MFDLIVLKANLTNYEKGKPMNKRGMGAATKGGGCCMGGMAVKKYAQGSPKEGVTKDMLPWMSKELGKKNESSPKEGVTKDMLPWMSKEIGPKVTKGAKKPARRKPPFEPMVPRR